MEAQDRIKALEDRNSELLKIIEKLEAENRALRERIGKLEARLNQNSRNSSKPPSSDPPWISPKSPKLPSGRKPGGQPGHPGSHREIFPPDHVDQLVILKPSACERCGRNLVGEDPDPKRHQVIEIPELLACVTEYVLHRLTCGHCREVTAAELPAEVPAGLFGPRLQAVIAYLSGRGHQSKRQIQDMLGDIFGVSIGLGSIPAVEAKISEALEKPVEEAKAYVQAQPVANADESGWKQRGQRFWIWVATTLRVTVFLIHPRRGQEAAQALLGKFEGYLGSDRWGAYNRWSLRRRQICWAHLKRDFTRFQELEGKDSGLGTALLIQVEQLFRLWHQVRDGTLNRSKFRKQIEPVRMMIRAFLTRGARGEAPIIQTKCQKLLKVWPALWTFARVEGVEPTNNAAERAIRPAVLYRKGSFGTQSDAGSRFIERIFTVVATLRQQRRNVLEFLTEACKAHQASRPLPSLLPD